MIIINKYFVMNRLYQIFLLKSVDTNLKKNPRIIAESCEHLFLIYSGISKKSTNSKSVNTPVLTTLLPFWSMIPYVAPLLTKA